MPSSIKTLKIDDFSGGMRGGFATKRNANECVEMSNFWCQGVSLKPIKSHSSLTNSPALASTETASKFKRHFKYVDSSGNKYLIAKKGGTIWIGIPSTTDWTTSTTINWKPLFGDIRVNGNSFYKARPTGSKETFTSVGSIVYMSCDDPTDDDVVLKFDGFIYYSGTLKYYGVDSANRGIYESNTAGKDWEAAGVKAGDMLFFYDHDASVWRVGTDAGVSNGYMIAGIGYEGATPDGGAAINDIAFSSAPFIPASPPGARATLDTVITGDYSAQWLVAPSWTHLGSAGQITVDDQTTTKIRFHDDANNYYVLSGTPTYRTVLDISANAWNGFKFSAGVNAASDSATYYTNLGGNGFDGKFYLTVQTNAADQCWDTTGKGASGTDYVNYIIVRIKEAGIEEAPACTSAAVSISSTLDAGSYQYAFRYKDDVTGYTGRMSEPSAAITIAVDHTDGIQMQGWDTTPEFVNTLQIFRSKNAGIFYLVKEVDRNTGYRTNYLDALSANGQDNGWAIIQDSDGVNISAESDAFLRDRPRVLRNIKNFAGRLVGFGYGDEAHLFKISSLYNYEYFPSTNWSIDINTLSDDTSGGTFQIGANKHEPLTGMIAEGGAYQTTGITGDNLLLFTSSNAYRFFGTNWGNYQIVNAFAKGCVASDSIVNANGIILWVDQNHVLGVASGSNFPEAVSLPLFPIGIQNEITTTAPLANMADWCSCVWNNCYFLSLSLTANTNDTIYVMNLSSRTWFTLDYGANDFIVWDNPGSDDTFIMTITSAETNQSIVALFADSTTKVSSIWESGGLPIGSVINDSIHLKTLRIKAHGALTSSTIKVKIYDSNYPLELWNQTVALPANDNDSRGFNYIDLSPKCDAVEPSIRLETSSLPEMTIETLELDFETHGDGNTLKQAKR